MLYAMTKKKKKNQIFALQNLISGMPSKKKKKKKNLG